MSLLEIPPAPQELASLSAEQLAFYLTDSSHLALISRANEAYWYWGEFKRRLPAGADGPLLWQLARQQRQQNAWHFELTFESLRWQFSYNLPRRLQQELYQLDRWVGGERGADTALFSGQERN